MYRNEHINLCTLICRCDIIFMTDTESDQITVSETKHISLANKRKCKQEVSCFVYLNGGFIMNDKSIRFFILLAVIIYVLSPVDALPGPVDDVIVMFLTPKLIRSDPDE